MIVLLTAADRRYWHPLRCFLCSIAESNPQNNFQIHVAYADVPKHLRERARKDVDTRHSGIELIFHDFSDETFGGATLFHSSRLPYARLHVARHIPGERAIWVDSDMLVFKNLRLLWEHDLGGKVLAAVRSPLMTLGDDCPWPLTDAQAKLPYFQSGVMVIDLDRWRELGLEVNLLDHMRDKKNNLLYADQSVINYVCQGEIEPLDSAWNFCAPDTDWSMVRQTPVILHYLASTKPWRDCLPTMSHRLWRAYFNRVTGRAWQLWLNPRFIRSYLKQLSLRLAEANAFTERVYEDWLKFRRRWSFTEKQRHKFDRRLGRWAHRPQQFRETFVGDPNAELDHMLQIARAES